MVTPAGKIQGEHATSAAIYEQPLNERMRTLLRLEFLYQKLLYNSELESDWGSRATIDSLLDILAILSRGDIRSEVHKELDFQLAALRRFQTMPEVDGRRLDSLVSTLSENRQNISAIGTGFLQSLKTSEFLNAVKHRSAIPGGTCEFDLPEYSHWLRQPLARRQQDLDVWIDDIRPVCDAASEILWLIRESAQPVEKLATKGMYQHTAPRDMSCRLLRIEATDGSELFPEISGSQHRFIVRFLKWSKIDSRAVQTERDVPFELSIC
jgi:cell division protein ZapD